MAITRTAKGTAQSKSSSTTLALASVTCAAGDLLVVALAYDDVSMVSVTWGTQQLTLGESALGAGVRTRIAYGVVATGGTQTVTATWAASLTAKAMAVATFASNTAGVTAFAEHVATLTGNGTAASTGALAAITGGTDSILFGVVGTEGPNGDVAGTWVTPNTNGQRLGTTGGGAATNVTVSTGYQLAPAAGTTPALSKTGMTGRDWGAVLQAFYWAAPPTPKAGTDTAGATEAPALDVLITPQPGTTTYAADDFSVDSASGLPDADVGGAWTVNSTTFVTSSGGFAHLNTDAANVTRSAFLHSATPALDVELTGKFKRDKLAAGSTFGVHIAGRTASGSDYYRVTYLFTTTGAVQISAQAVSTAVGTTVTVARETDAADVLFNFKVRYTGANPTTIQAKIWRDGTAEPAAWDFETTDSTAALQDAGAYGIRAYNGSAPTNAPIVVSFESLTATSIPSTPVASDVVTLGVVETATAAEDTGGPATPQTGADTATGTEVAIVSVPVASADAAAGVDALSVVERPGSDVATGADTVASRGVVAFEAGAGADVGTRTDEGQAGLATDVAVGNDAVAIVGKPGADAGAGADAAVAGKAGADTAAGGDVASIAATLAGADTAAGADTGSAADAGLAVFASDAGSGVEVSTETAGPGAAETGVGVDVATLTASATAADTGTGADAGAVSTARTAVDTAASSDTSTIRDTATVDAGASIDAVRDRAFVAVDVASAVEASARSIAGSDFAGVDAAVGADVAIVAAAAVASDVGTAADASTLAAGAALTRSDSAAGVDVATITRAIVSGDTGSGGDASAAGVAHLVTDATTAADVSEPAAAHGRVDVALGADLVLLEGALLAAELAALGIDEDSTLATDVYVLPTTLVAARMTGSTIGATATGPPHATVTGAVAARAGSAEVRAR